MADRPKIDLIVPRFVDNIPFYQAADQMGFHALWFTEMLFSYDSWRGKSGLDRYGALTAAASATSRIRLATALTGSPRPRILPFATKMTDLDSLSGGRLSLGISQHDWPDEGVPEPRHPKIGGRLKETITVLKRLWSGPEVSFKGSRYNLERASIDATPVQLGGIPIFVDGITSASVNQAATLADGWVHPSGGIPGGAARGSDMVRKLATRAGRDPNSMELGKIIYVSIDNHRFRAKARARERLAQRLQSFYGGYNVDSWCAFGKPAQCAAFINAFFDAGITTVMLCLVPADVEHLELLHREVLPLLN
ncbi:MAG: LLM class flavin-dependent oxidoreductase [Chloroflexi bacterium]|nr:LLM class flavin-dependent oxidoreductase [Chloroflexota bacterium]